MCKQQSGFALISAMLVLALLMVLLVGYFTLTSVERATTLSSMDSLRGFYAAEGGLNVRADALRQILLSGTYPTGPGPDTSGGTPPCKGSNQGSGDFACTSLEFSPRDVSTYLGESPLSTDSIVIPRGEIFQDLFATETHYIVHSRADNANHASEALLELHVKARSVPLFQFAAFYNKDLEILPGDAMLLAGPVHSNGDLYVGSGITLGITRQVTVAGDLYRGRKDSNTCLVGQVLVNDPAVLTEIPPCVGGRTRIDQADVAGWDPMIETAVDSASVASMGILDPVATSPYWANADLRIVLDMGLPGPPIQALDSAGNLDPEKGALLTACAATLYTPTLYNNREGALIHMLEFDMGLMLTCANIGTLLDIDLTAGEASPVIFLSVTGPGAAGLNNYGVRVSNAAELTPLLPGGVTSLRALTLVSDQAVYLQGDFNAINKKPAAVLGDSINVISAAWLDSNSALALSLRVPGHTTINAALLAGTDTTGGVEGAGGQDAGTYNGGVENFMRLHENWAASTTLTYRGSFVSLGQPRHVQGPYVDGSPQFTRPLRDWAFETDFEDPALLPPMTPAFVYLKQELFVRLFEL